MDRGIPIAYCEYCKEPIYGANEQYYADTACFDGSVWFCENCKDRYLEQFRIDKECV